MSNDPTKVTMSHCFFFSDLFRVINMLVSIIVLFAVCWGPTLIDNVLIAVRWIALTTGISITCVRLSPLRLTSTAVPTLLSTHSCRRTFATVSGMHCCACAAVDGVDVGINMGRGCEVSHTRQGVCGKIHFRVHMDQVI